MGGVRSNNPVQVNLNTAVSDPIVGKSQDDLDAVLARCLDDTVKSLQAVGAFIEGPVATVPEL
jgi:hypothetical protein